MADVPSTRAQLTEDVLSVVDRVRPWAEARGHTLAELAIAWLLAHPETSTVIAGARTAEQFLQNVRAADWALSAAEREEVSAVARGDPPASAA
jgi:aryl-alcohol dehydrogenase-like predicted oxidoreductase